MDNILDMGYLKTLVPKLGDAPVGDLFFETKGNLSREQSRFSRGPGFSGSNPASRASATNR